MNRPRSNPPSPPVLERPIQENINLARFTTWRIGGPARWLAQPNEEEAACIFRWGVENDIPTFVLGRGSNVLIPDQGFPGLVILTRDSMTNLVRHGDYIVAGGGVPLPRISRFAAAEGFSGFEFLIGIPGTVGGGLAMNAGLTVFRPREMVAVVDSFDVAASNGNILTLGMADVHAGYRTTSLLTGTQLVVRARFRLEEVGDPDVIGRATSEHLQERKSKQPLDKPTAGSTFKSPPGSKGAGFYIEEAGLKGFQIGGVRISEKHANWIENTGSGTADDVKRLMDHVRSHVQKNVGVELEPEVRVL